MMIVLQSCFGIHKTIMLNISFWLLFNISNMKEIDLIYPENSGFKQKKFENIFEVVTRKPFGFLCINHQNIQ